MVFDKKKLQVGVDGGGVGEMNSHSMLYSACTYMYKIVSGG